MRFVLQSLDADGFVINNLFEGNDTVELLMIARAADPAKIRIWDRMRQAEYDRGTCPECESQPCQCAHRRAPGWLDALEKEIADMKEAA